MAVTASVLRELHRIHKQLADLNGRLGQGPRLLRTAQTLVDRCTADCESASEELTRAKVASDAKLLQLKEREARIESLNGKLNAAASNREFQTLKEQIAADEQANSVLSDEILEALEHIDELTEAGRRDTDALKVAQAELDKTSESVKQTQAGLTSERDRVQAELDKAESGLPADFRADYDRIAEARGEDALAESDGSNCGACFTRLTPNSLAELHMQLPVFCNSCGALLYLGEDSSVGGSAES